MRSQYGVAIGMSFTDASWYEIWNQVRVSRKPRKLFSPKQSFVKIWTTHSINLCFKVSLRYEIRFNLTPSNLVVCKIEWEFISRWSMIVRVSEVLRRTVCGDIDWRFDNLSESHHQNQVMTSGQVADTSVSVTTNNPSKDFTHLDNHTLPTYDMTPRFKPFTECKQAIYKLSCASFSRQVWVHNPAFIWKWVFVTYEERRTRQSENVSYSPRNRPVFRLSRNTRKYRVM